MDSKKDILFYEDTSFFNSAMAMVEKGQSFQVVLKGNHANQFNKIKRAWKDFRAPDQPHLEKGERMKFFIFCFLMPTFWSIHWYAKGKKMIASGKEEENSVIISYKPI